MKATHNHAPISVLPQLAKHNESWPLLRKLRRMLSAIRLARHRGNRIIRSRSRIGGQDLEKPTPERKCWKVAFGCVAGTRHLNQGRNCEDAVGSFVAGQLLGVAIADGAGSAPRGGLGATVAVRAALAAIQHAYLNGDPTTQGAAREILCSAFRCALKSLTDEAARCSLPPSDLACTLIVVISDGSFVAAGQVGDGSVVISDAAPELITLSTPTNGEFANETALLGCGAFVDVKLSVANNPIREIAACTDGIQRLALNLPDGTPYAGFFGPLFRGIGELTEVDAERALAAFLLSPPVAARTDDDKTLLVAQISCG
jgi:hypothetical protein